MASAGRPGKRVGDTMFDGVTKIKGDIGLIVVTGRITSENSEQFANAIQEVAKEAGVRLLIDMAGLDYMSSAGLGVILNARKNMGAGRLFLSAPNETVRKVLAVGQLEDLIIKHDCRRPNDIEAYLDCLKEYFAGMSGSK